MIPKNGKVKWTVEQVDVTPATAEKWLSKNIHNRDMRINLVQTYADAMAAGEWTLSPEPIAFCDNWVDPDTKEEFGETLVDGQHRLRAVIQSECTVPFMVWFHVDAEVFKVMGQGRQRNQTDLLKITRRTMKNPGAVASTISSFLRYGLGLSRAVDSWMVRRILAEIEEEIIVVVSLKKKVSGLVQRQFMAALVLAILSQPSDVESLVNSLRHGTGFTYNDPRKALREYLYDQRLNPSRDIAQIHFLKVCDAIAASFQGDQRKRLRTSTEGLTWLRKKARDRLDVLTKEIFGKVPEGFYAPKLSPRLLELAA